MPTLVGVSLRTAGKIHVYEAGNLALEPGEPVVIETVRGLELGEVVPVPADLPPEAAGRPPRTVLRRADQEDLDQHFRNRVRAAEALALSRERVRHHDLPMKMLDAELTLDGGKLLLYFGSEDRVDFRALVRDLAAMLRKRIELQQVGARDRSALTGGLGPCGRECCCSSWIRDFFPVSIKMAKEQGLSLNPSKISGVCGRLLCCLRYEHQTYREAGRSCREEGAPCGTCPSPRGRPAAVEAPMPPEPPRPEARPRPPRPSAETPAEARPEPPGTEKPRGGQEPARTRRPPSRPRRESREEKARGRLEAPAAPGSSTPAPETPPAPRGGGRKGRRPEGRRPRKEGAGPGPRSEGPPEASPEGPQPTGGGGARRGRRRGRGPRPGPEGPRRPEPGSPPPSP